MRRLGRIKKWCETYMKEGVLPDNERLVGEIEVCDKETGRLAFLDLADTEHWGPIQDEFPDNEPTHLTTTDLYRHPNKSWTLVVDTFNYGCNISESVIATRMNDGEAVDWLFRNCYQPPVDVAHLMMFYPDTPPADKEHLVVTNDTASSEQESPVDIPADNEPPSPPKPTPRLTVNTQTNCAVLDGIEHKLSPEQALFVNGLVEADGVWRSSTEMNVTKVDRLKNNMPAPIRDLIESKPGKGSIIPRKKLWDS